MEAPVCRIQEKRRADRTGAPLVAWDGKDTASRRFIRPL
jgi:hypothetical protein